MAAALLASRYVTPNTKKVWIGLLGIVLVVGFLSNSLPLADYLRLPDQYGWLIDLAWLVIVMLVAGLIVPRLAKNIALSDLRKREPDGFGVSVLQPEEGLEFCWKNSLFRFGWADISQLIVGAGQLIIIHGANLAFPILLSAFSSDEGSRAFIRACAAKLTPVALERSRASIAPYLA